MAKYDWDKLKLRFLTGSWLTLAEFFRSQDIKYNSKSRTRAKGWLIERRQYQEGLNRQARARLLEKDTTTQFRLQRISTQLQLKGLQKLNQTNDIDSKTAVKLLITGLQEERKALGIDEPVKSRNKAKTTGKTRLDVLVDQMDYQELMGLIAELKTIRDQRLVTKG